MSAALVVKNLSAKAGDIRDMDSIPELGKSPGGGHGNLLQYSYLENLRDRGAQQATIHIVAKSQTLNQLSMYTGFLNTHTNTHPILVWFCSIALVIH